MFCTTVYTAKNGFLEVLEFVADTERDSRKGRGGTCKAKGHT